jgi:hypothetical protein
VPGQIRGQESVGSSHVVNPRQTQRLDQPIQQGLEQPLDSPFGLRRERLYPRYPQRADGPLELRRFPVFRVVFGENAVPVM